MKKVIHLSSYIIAFLFVIACSSEEQVVPPTPKPPTPSYDALAISSNSVSIPKGENATITITSGSGSYNVNSSNNNITTASLSSTTITINAVEVGEATIRVTDVNSNETKNIAVTIQANTQGNRSFSINKVYYVGHSLINFNIPYQVNSIANTASVTNDYRHHINNGASLQQNWTDTGFISTPIWNASLGRNVQFGTNHLTELTNSYDALVLTEAIPLENYSVATTVEYAKNFIDKAKEGNPNIQPFIYATWEHGAGTASWRTSLNTLESKWQEIADNLTTQTGTQVYLIPGNLAMKKLYDELASSSIGGYNSINDFFQPDNVHLKPEGNYYIACVMSAILYGVDVEGQGTIKGGPFGDHVDVITDATARLRIQQLAKEVACEYLQSIGYETPCN